MPLSASSQKVLSTVGPEMQAVVKKCALTFPLIMIVDQGNRTAEQEMALWLACHNKDGTRNDEPWRTNCNGYALGTKAPNGCAGTGLSNHQGGFAVDIVVQRSGKIIWNGADPVYSQLNDAMQAAADSLGIKIKWGARFPKPDPDHWEVDRD